MEGEMYLHAKMLDSHEKTLNAKTLMLYYKENSLKRIYFCLIAIQTFFPRKSLFKYAVRLKLEGVLMSKYYSR